MFRTKYQTRNTKHVMNSTFNEIIKIEYLINIFIPKEENF